MTGTFVYICDVVVCIHAGYVERVKEWRKFRMSADFFANSLPASNTFKKMKTIWEQNVLFLYICFGLILFFYWLVQNFMYKNGTSILILILKIGTCYN